MNNQFPGLHYGFLSGLFLLLIAGCQSNPPSKSIMESGSSVSDGRPNVLLIVIDDLGFTDLGSYGSEIRTPNLDKLAEDGLRFSNFYVSPNCAPTRSMLLSGMDHHMAGNGTMLEHIVDNQRGAPGYEGYLNERVATLPQVLKQAGYHTYMAGKWHLGIEEETSPAARGFDESFALLLGGGSHFSDKAGLVSPKPVALYRQNGKLVDALPDDFYSTRFYTDTIMQYIDSAREADAAPSPFFAYLAYTAVHWPLQVPPEAMDLYQGHYADGYDELRQNRFRSGLQAGVVQAGTRLHPGAAAVPSWESLSEPEQARQSRKMEIYAAMLELVDRNVGRLLDHLRQVGELDNTLILVMSDNGAEGNRRERMGGDDWVANTFDQSYEAMGARGSYVDFGPGWAQASSAPFRLWKAHTAEGGIRAPLIASGVGVNHRGAITPAISTVKDIMPTILEAAKVETPKSVFQNRRILPITGRSQSPLLRGAAEIVHTSAETFGWEIFGGRALRSGKWKLLWVAGPNGENRWQLYDLHNDPGETLDLSAAEPLVMSNMKEKWAEYVQANNVILPDETPKGSWGDED